MKKVIIYTDGACSGNPGMGGWGAVLLYGETIVELSGFDKDTTNNKMELTAAVEALSKLKYPCDVELYSDSAYLINGFNQYWLKNWKTKGWKTASGDPVKNEELWKDLDRLASIHNISWIKVKGHADNEYNNKCDKLATDEIKKNKI